MNLLLLLENGAYTKPNQHLGLTASIMMFSALLDHFAVHENSVGHAWRSALHRTVVSHGQLGCNPCVTVMLVEHHSSSLYESMRCPFFAMPNIHV